MFYWDEIFNSQSESTTLVDMNSGSTGTAGAYAPAAPGKITRVRLMWAGEAATSLFEYVRVELNCTLWTPNTLRFGLVGAGLRTAPAFPVPYSEYELDQPINPNQVLKGQVAYADAATPITCNLRVLALFWTP